MDCKRIDGCNKNGNCDRLGQCFIEALQLKRWLPKQVYTRACTLDFATCIWCSKSGFKECAFSIVVEDILDLKLARLAKRRGGLIKYWIDDSTYFTSVVKNPQKLKILYRDKVCLNCGTNYNLTIDHIFPASKGGSNAVINLRALCADCNVKKADKILE